MAPEVVERKAYDSKGSFQKATALGMPAHADPSGPTADIWSFGITALELASGRAPNSLYPPAKVLSKTLLDEPPTLDREGGRYKYSKGMKDMISSCLSKDPTKRSVDGEFRSCINDLIFPFQSPQTQCGETLASLVLPTSAQTVVPRRSHLEGPASARTASNQT